VVVAAELPADFVIADTKKEVSMPVCLLPAHEYSYNSILIYLILLINLIINYVKFTFTEVYIPI